MDAQSPHVNPDAELHSVPTWPGTLTVLRTIDAALATKRWIWRTALGEWSKCSYQAGAWFHPEEHPIASLRDLGSVLERVSRNPRAFVVRGALAPWVRDNMEHGNGRPIRRRKLKKGDDNPSLIEVPCPWLMIDIDNFPLRPSDDLADDPESAIEHAIRPWRTYQGLSDARPGVPRHGSLVAAFILGRLQCRYAQSAYILLAV